MTVSSPPRVRPATEADLEAVVAIERAAFRVPWSKALFARELEHDWSRLLLAVLGDRVAGFIVFWIIRDEVHLLDMAVDPDDRRRRLGSLLLDACIDAARAADAAFVTLEVRVSNEAARHLYASHGFKPTGVRKRYYENPPAPGTTAPSREDAVIMELTL